MQKSIPCVLMRGGTSRGPYLMADDLPEDIAMRDAVLLAVMGSPDTMQVNGLGGGQPQTSKVAIISRSTRTDCDVDYLFAQVDIDEARVDTKPNCGNMLAGVGPFAIEAGLVKVADPVTSVRIFNVNTGARIDARVETPDGRVNYEGDTAIAGVAGTAAAIPLTFRDFVGAKTGKLFPTGEAMECIDGITVTLVDSAMPMLLLCGKDIGLASLDAVKQSVSTGELFRRTEPLRLIAGQRMGFGDVAKSVIPKVGILFPSGHSTIEVAYLMPWALHQSLAVTGAIAIATACAAEGTVAARLAQPLTDEIAIRHPAGIMHLGIERGDGSLTGATVMRTARRIFEGRVFVPAEFYATV
ncbi:MAG: 2-methylaconitate cis-trans isomerase PrpF family protein [Beijerinckiaceae bacterium]